MEPYDTTAGRHIGPDEQLGGAVNQADRQHLLTATKSLGCRPPRRNHYHRAGHANRHATAVARQSAELQW